MYDAGMLDYLRSLIIIYISAQGLARSRSTGELVRRLPPNRAGLQEIHLQPLKWSTYPSATGMFSAARSLGSHHTTP
jgi:hypothetical protein